MTGLGLEPHLVRLRPAAMTSGPRQGPRCLFSIAWTAQYLHLSHGKRQAPIEVQVPMRNAW
jgi:hypothetical protein